MAASCGGHESLIRHTLSRRKSMSIRKQFSALGLFVIVMLFAAACSPAAAPTTAPRPASGSANSAPATAPTSAPVIAPALPDLTAPQPPGAARADQSSPTGVKN